MEIGPVHRLEEIDEPIELIHLDDAVAPGVTVDRAERDGQQAVEGGRTIGLQDPERTPVEDEVLGELRLVQEGGRNILVAVGLFCDLLQPLLLVAPLQVPAERFFETFPASSISASTPSATTVAA